MKPYYQDDAVTIYHGDCREILPGLPAASVDVTVTDPPYQSLDVQVSEGTTTRLVSRDKFTGKRLAASDGAEWFITLDGAAIASVLEDCRRLLKSDGALYVFADVKSGLDLFPGWVRNVIVWDKGSIGMGYAWRRMHEWIGYQPMPGHKLRDQSLGDIIRARGVDAKEHPTEKPIGVLAPLIRNSSDPGGLVLDPFMGSGSTLVAAKVIGRQSIGIEINERHCETAARRLSQEVLGLSA